MDCLLPVYTAEWFERVVCVQTSEVTGESCVLKYRGTIPNGVCCGECLSRWTWAPGCSSGSV